MFALNQCGYAHSTGYYPQELRGGRLWLFCWTFQSTCRRRKKKMEQIKCNTTRFIRGVAWKVWQMDPGPDYFVQMPFLMDRRKALLKQRNIPICIKRLSNKNKVYNCTANKSVNKSVLLLPLPRLSVWLGPSGGFSIKYVLQPPVVTATEPEWHLSASENACSRKRACFKPRMKRITKSCADATPFHLFMTYFNHWGWRSFGTTNHKHSYTDMVGGQCLLRRCLMFVPFWLPY